jgi:phage-related minor tail protein
MASVTQFGPILRGMGFDFETSTALIAQFDKEGIDMGAVTMGMKKALVTMAKEGMSDPQEVLIKYINAIKNAKNTIEATGIAVELFGARGGAAMAMAIREGRLDFNDLVESLKNGTDTIDEAAKATDDWKEKLKLLRNRIMLVAEPLAGKFFDSIGGAVDQIEAKLIPALEDLIPKIEPVMKKIIALTPMLVDLAMKGILFLVAVIAKLVTWFSNLSPTWQKVILAALGFAVALGPILLGIGQLIPLIKLLTITIGILKVVSLGEIMLIIAGIAALIAIGILLYKNWDKIKGWAINIWTAIRNFFANLWENIKKIFSIAINAIWEGLTFLPKMFWKALQATYDVVIKIAKNIYKALQYLNPFARHSPSLVEEIEIGIDIIKAKFAELPDVIPDVITLFGAMEKVQSAFTKFNAQMDAAKQAEINKYLSVVGKSFVRSYKDVGNAIATVRQRLVDIAQAWKTENTILEGMKKRVDDLTKRLEVAQNRLSYFMNAPLKGSKAFSDAIFDNETEIAKLQLKILQLKKAGADEDVIAPLEAQLEDLQTTGEELRLQERIELDPLRREIDETAQTSEELDFQTIINGIVSAQNEINTLTPQLNEATLAMNDQQEKVSALAEAYEFGKKMIEEYRSSLEEMVSLAREKYDELEQAREESIEKATEKGAGGGGLLEGLEGLEVPEIEEFDTSEIDKQIDEYFDNLSGNISEKVGTFWSEAWENIKEGAKIMFGAGFFVDAWENIKAGFEILKSNWTTNWQSFSDFFVNLWNGISNFFVNTWETIKSTFLNALNFVILTITTSFNGIWLLIQLIWNGITTFFTNLWEGLKLTFTSAIDAMKLGLSTAWTAITTGVTTAWDAIKLYFSDAWESIQKGLDSFKEGFLAVWESIKDGVKVAVNGIIKFLNKLIEGIEKVINFASKGLSKIPGVSIPTVTLGRIPELYKGGIVEQAGYVDVGERGRERVFLPKGAEVRPLGKTSLITQYNTFTSPKPLSEAEIKRQNELLIRKLALEFSLR